MTSLSGAGTARPRDAAATRGALLTAARELFATEGYDGTTVRAVAERAGVNQALLFRYFGNKEALFAEAVRGQALALIAAGPPETLLERTLGSLLSDEPGARMFFAVLRSAGNSEVAETVRDELGSAYSAAFSALVDTDDPDDAAVRADLLLAWLLGIGLLRSVMHAGTLPLADAGEISTHVMRAAAALLGPPHAT